MMKNCELEEISKINDEKRVKKCWTSLKAYDAYLKKIYIMDENDLLSEKN